MCFIERASGGVGGEPQTNEGGAGEDQVAADPGCWTIWCLHEGGKVICQSSVLSKCLLFVLCIILGMEYAVSYRNGIHLLKCISLLGEGLVILIIFDVLGWNFIIFL